MIASTLGRAVAASASAARFRDLLERYRAPVARLCAAYEPNPADREDLVQDIWLAVWRALSAFRGDSCERTYLFRIAHKRAITHVNRRSPATTEPDEAFDAPHRGEPAELALQRTANRERLLTAIRRLPPVQREVVLLVLEGLSQREIAAVLGITETNVGARTSRARAELTRRLGSRE